MENQTVNEGKTAAIIAYFTIVGTIVAYIMNINKKNSFTSFHIRQMIGILLIAFINKFVIYDMLGGFIAWLIGASLVILWVIGFLGVLKGEEKEVPVVGEYFQKWFAGI